jgi:hypothetical protein
MALMGIRQGACGALAMTGVRHTDWPLGKRQIWSQTPVQFCGTIG